MNIAKDKRPGIISGIERINQRQNHLLGTNIKRLRLERGLRNCDVICQLQLRGIDICFSSYFKVEAGGGQSDCRYR